MSINMKSWLLALAYKTFIRGLCQAHFLKQLDCLGGQAGICPRETSGWDCGLCIQQLYRGYVTQKCQGIAEPERREWIWKSVKEGAGVRKRRITLHGAAESLRILRMKGLS